MKCGLLLGLVIHMNLSNYQGKETGSTGTFVKLICHFMVSLFVILNIYSQIHLGCCGATFTDEILKKAFWPEV